MNAPMLVTVMLVAASPAVFVLLPPIAALLMAQGAVRSTARKAWG